MLEQSLNDEKKFPKLIIKYDSKSKKDWFLLTSSEVVGHWISFEKSLCLERITNHLYRESLIFSYRNK